MNVASVRAALLLCVVLVVGCAQAVAPVSTPGTTLDSPPGSEQPAPATPAGDAGAALLADDSADYTVGDTARLSGGEFLGDQADLTVLEAKQLPANDLGEAQFAFLVEITGLDDASFHFNLLNFQLIDEQSFQYDALADGGQEPALDFGDLAPNQKVRGWVTFAVSEPTSTLRLEYAPIAALESATFGFIVP